MEDDLKLTVKYLELLAKYEVIDLKVMSNEFLAALNYKLAKADKLKKELEDI